MAVDQQSYLPEDILVKVDRDSMLNSLEVRVPFLDHRIVEFANTLPTDVKIRRGVQKFILRELLKDLAPAGIVQRGKQGFGMPLRDWLRGRYYDFSCDLLLSSDSRISRFFKPEKIKALIHAHKHHKRDLSDRIWCLLWLEQWCRHFKI
jgi:asparagine synthase (glutamine-hydrolysing)